MASSSDMMLPSKISVVAVMSRRPSANRRMGADSGLSNLIFILLSWAAIGQGPTKSGVKAERNRHRARRLVEDGRADTQSRAFNDKSSLKDKIKGKLSPRFIVGREPKAAPRCARANNRELLIPRETVLTHRERFAVDHNRVVRESADDGKQQWRASRPPLCAPVPEQVFAVAILQSDQFCAVRGNLRNQALAPDHN